MASREAIIREMKDWQDLIDTPGWAMFHHEHAAVIERMRDRLEVIEDDRARGAISALREALATPEASIERLSEELRNKGG